jgi:hypothetical protein
VGGVTLAAREGGRARRRRGVQPKYNGKIQLVGSRSFTRWRRGCAHKEFENGVVAYSVHTLRWAEEVRRGWYGVSGGVALGLRVWEASWVSGEANRAAGVGEGWLGWAGRSGRSSGGSTGGGALGSRPRFRRLSAASVWGWGKDVQGLLAFIGVGARRAHGRLDHAWGRARGCNALNLGVGFLLFPPPNSGVTLSFSLFSSLNLDLFQSYSGIRLGIPCKEKP